MRKNVLKAGAMLFAGVLAMASCTTKEQKEATNENENTAEKVEVKDVEGRKNFGDAGIITPLPAIMIATYDAEENPDVMMAAWGGQCGPKHICFNLSAHKTTDNIRLKKAFTVSFATKNDIVQSDYFGIVSANDVPDKVARAGFTVTKSPNVDAPIVNEYPLTLECKVVQMDEDENGGARVVGEIVNMSAQESILNEEGKVDLSKLQPVIFDSSNNTYRVVGEQVGTAWGSGKAIQEKEVK
jgi:flavin reductase (DIM6/NTAB) family NADH-FMN oxidoreductase RutF